MKLFNIFKKKDKNSLLKTSEKKEIIKPKKEKLLKVMDVKKKYNKMIMNEFNNQKIVLLTDLRDYVDLREFTEKTRGLDKIQAQLKKIIQNKNVK